MREKRKESMLVTGFLLDRDVTKTASLFPAKSTYTIAQVGLPDNASDAQIVQKAWDLCLTIVTSNGDHFVNEILKFQRRTKEKDCRELFGLVVLPNGYEDQRRQLLGIRNKLRLGYQEADMGRCKKYELLHKSEKKRESRGEKIRALLLL